jgi:hypothetical protein
MREQSKKLFVVLTDSTEHELSSVGFTIANGGITAGLSVSIFLALIRVGHIALDMVGMTDRIWHAGRVTLLVF